MCNSYLDIQKVHSIFLCIFRGKISKRFITLAARVRKLKIFIRGAALPQQLGVDDVDGVDGTIGYGCNAIISVIVVTETRGILGKLRKRGRRKSTARGSCRETRTISQSGGNAIGANGRTASDSS